MPGRSNAAVALRLAQVGRPAIVRAGGIPAEPRGRCCTAPALSGDRTDRPAAASPQAAWSARPTARPGAAARERQSCWRNRRDDSAFVVKTPSTYKSAEPDSRGLRFSARDERVDSKATSKSAAMTGQGWSLVWILF